MGVKWKRLVLEKEENEASRRRAGMRADEMPAWPRLFQPTGRCINEVNRQTNKIS